MPGEESEPKLLDRYDVVGVAIPGALLLFGMWFLFQFNLEPLKLGEASLGSLGLFTIAAFCVGHVVQALANIVFDSLWHLTGRPTERMRRLGCGLADAQVKQIAPQVAAMLGLEIALDAPDSQWKPVTAQIATLLDSRGQGAVLSRFNANYGLHRGLTTVLGIIVLVSLLRHLWAASATFALLGAATGRRTNRFSWYYARELWLRFLVLKGPEERT